MDPCLLLVSRNYSNYPLFILITALRVIIYICKLSAFAMLLSKIEDNLCNYRHTALQFQMVRACQRTDCLRDGQSSIQTNRSDYIPYNPVKLDLTPPSLQNEFLSWWLMLKPAYDFLMTKMKNSLQHPLCSNNENI